MRPHSVPGEPAVEESAGQSIEAQPKGSPIEFPALAQSLANAAAAREGSPDSGQPPEEAAHAHSRAKPKKVHWETFLKSKRGPGNPAE